MLDGAITIRAVPVGGTGKNSPLNTPASWPAAPMGYVHDQRGDMKKAPSTILATAGLTVGMLGFALPASAATSVTPIVTPAPPVVPIGTHTPPTGTHTPPTGINTPPTGTHMPPTGTHTPPTGTYTPPTGGSQTPPKRHRPEPGPTQHHPKPVYHPKPTPTCHPQPKPKPPVKPIGYNKGSNKYKGYTTALYSWEHPKWGHIVKCDPKPVKHPVKHPASPKHHHHAPKKHWWQGWFN